MMRCSSMVEHPAVNRTVAGSSPAAAAKRLINNYLERYINDKNPLY